ncbi:enoyl-CoA hydratase/isomerase family protein [Actinospongicola halichondriae]|uniref:enoyl-CoA hydratase/isomerase family protein n=1 Tax=Actinospongicola halichondriae TaxID=3236844 RepID=UPI003D4A70D5
MTDAPTGPDLLIDDRDGVRRITLNRADAANSITPDQRDGVIASLEEASGRLDIRVVVLGAAGQRHFCTGADLRASRPMPPKPEGAPDRPVGQIARVIQEGAQRLMAAVLDCEKPVVAAVNGTAAGIGAHLAFCCDMVVAAEHAKFVEIFVRRGLVPDGAGAWLLPRIIGIQKTKELFFLGDDLPAADAATLGLVNRVVPADRLEAEVDALAARLAASPTVAISLAKRLVNSSLDVDRATAFRDEASAQERNMSTHDANEGVQSFVERRDPDYLGW